MGKDCRYERLPPGPAEEIRKRILEFRNRCEQYEKPDEVNELLGLFPRVRLQEGYMLDYFLEKTGEVVQGILPFARPEGEEDFLLGSLLRRGEVDQVEVLYPYLDYERSPQGLFEYALFITELWSTRASWQAAEWLASTPIFTREHFVALVEQARRMDSLAWPEWYGPVVGLEEEGGVVRFLVYTEMGWERIYYLEIAVDGLGRTELQAGEIVADFGPGLLF